MGTSAVRVRVLAAGLILIAAGCVFLGWASRSRQGGTKASAQPSAEHNQTALASYLDASGSSSAARSAASNRAPSNASSLLAHLPMIFEPNQGQANLNPSDPRARFLAHGSGYSLTLGAEGATISLQSRRTVESLRMKLAGANPNAIVSGTDLLPGKSNYLLGSDPAKWRQNVPQFARVRYENVYPGINLVFYGNQGHLEYDFQVAPGADPSQAELQFNGAKHLDLQDGALIIRTHGSAMSLEAPQVYQEIGGRRQPVDGRFVLRGPHRAGFAIGAYDRSRELVIDP